jgi:tripeptidyl-peptidase-1
MLISIALTALLAPIGTLANPIQIHESPYAIKETHFVPTKWERIGEAPGNHVVNLRIGLKQSRFEELERHLWEGKIFN